MSMFHSVPGVPRAKMERFSGVNIARRVYSPGHCFARPTFSSASRKEG